MDLETGVEELLQRVQQLFAAEDYAQALEISTWGVAHFSEQAPLLSYFRACAAARLDDMDLFVAIVEAAQAGGICYSEQIYRETPSFQPLQGNPLFEQLRAKNLELLAADVSAAPEPLTLIPEPADGGPYPLLLSLHGNSSDVQAEAPPWQTALAQGWALGMPESSQYNWKGSYIWDDRERSVREVKAYYDSLLSQQSIDAARVVLGGFSLGAQVALWMALSATLPVRGFVVLSPYLPELESWEPLIAQYAGHGLRGYMIVVDGDPIVGENHARFVELLNAHGVPCELDVCPGGDHFYPPDFAEHLARGLEFVGQ